MAISYVGGNSGASVGSTSTDLTISLTALAGGSDTSPSEGDLVVITVFMGHGNDAPTPSLVSTGYTALGQLDAEDTYDSAMNLFYKFMGATPDSSVVVTRSNDTTVGVAASVQVFRGVSQTTPLDVAAVAATGTDIGQPDPGPITPVTTGAWIVIGCGAAHASITEITLATLTNVVTAGIGESVDSAVAMGTYTEWVSGEYDPAQAGGGSTSSFASWTAYTLALRPDTGASYDSDAAATLTWGSSSTATSNVDADAAAALTWTGAATAASDFDQDAAASVTWTGLTVQIEAADLSAAAAASLTWNGATVASATLDADAAAALTWNGIATASAAYSSDATASLTWNGTSIAASDFDHDALADLQWVSEVSATAAGDFDMDAAASVTWGGTGLYPAALDSAAAATLEWGGTGLAPSAFDAAAAATLAAVGASDASADWTASPAATLTWDGEEVAAPGEAAWSADAVADLTATGESIAAAAASMEATASLIMRGIDASPAARDIDGRVRRRGELDRIEEFDEEDILVLTAALYSYLEQSNGY